MDVLTPRWKCLRGGALLRWSTDRVGDFEGWPGRTGTTEENGRASTPRADADGSGRRHGDEPAAGPVCWAAPPGGSQRGAGASAAEPARSAPHPPVLRAAVLALSGQERLGFRAEPTGRPSVAARLPAPRPGKNTLIEPNAGHPHGAATRLDMLLDPPRRRGTFCQQKALDENGRQDHPGPGSGRFRLGR